MGNQNVKGSHKSKSTIDISGQQDKKSRTNWKAGKSYLLIIFNEVFIAMT